MGGGDLRGEIGYHKIHDAYLCATGGVPLIPADVTRGALYFVRNPLDVVVSYAAPLHRDAGSDDRANGRPHSLLRRGAERLHQQLRQRLLSWSGHVESWVDQHDIEVHLCRYEDMHSSAEATFTAAAAFAGLPTEPVLVAKALRFATFDVLRAQEVATGFRERSPAAESFFRQGTVGSWRGRLDAGQVRRIVADHGRVMERFGYLDEHGEPVF